MRLTNTIKDAFIRSAMNDVPKIDYDEQARQIATKAVEALMPAALQRAIKAEPVIAAWLDKNYLHFPNGLGSCFLTCPAETVDRIRKDPLVWNQITLLGGKATEQFKARSELEAKLRAATGACTTRKQLEAALPEFVKYLPTEVTATVNLPAIANLVTDFMAAGWPKQKAANDEVMPKGKTGNSVVLVPVLQAA